MKIETFRQIFKFGAVGITATSAHALIFISTLRLLGWPEQISNLAAFIIAFAISWTGNYFWTFRTDGWQTSGWQTGGWQTGGWQTVPRFVAVALSGYLLNALFVFIIITKLGWPDFYVLPLMLLITPIMTFLLARYWAFK